MVIVTNKRGQQMMGMPFGMIFAIFLIVVFVVIAFIAIGFFLDLGRSSGVGMFYNELQQAVDSIDQSGEFDFKIDLPGEIEEVCFGNLSNNPDKNHPRYDELEIYDIQDANVFLVPPEKAQGMQWKFIKHIDIENITVDSNPYCVPVERGLRISKGFYDKLVMIS